jgi:hypothetical protein
MSLPWDGFEAEVERLKRAAGPRYMPSRREIELALRRAVAHGIEMARGSMSDIEVRVAREDWRKYGHDDPRTTERFAPLSEAARGMYQLLYDYAGACESCHGFGDVEREDEMVRCEACEGTGFRL